MRHNDEPRMIWTRRSLDYLVKGASGGHQPMGRYNIRGDPSLALGGRLSLLLRVFGLSPIMFS